MTLWTPANLATAAKSIFDPSTFTFSGGAFVSGSDQGSLGGAFSGSCGQSTLNGINVATFNGSSQNIIGASKTWTAGDDLFIFLVIKANKLNPGAIVSQAWGTSTTGWVLYPSLTNPGSTNGGQKSWLAGDSVAFGSGFGSASVQNVTIGHAYTSNAAYHLLALKVGSASLYQLDGVAQTPGAVTGANPTVTASIIWGNDAFGTEWFTGNLAYGLLAVNPTAGDIDRLNGWASWNFAGDGSMLPIGHTYKSAAPTVSDITLSLTGVSSTFAAGLLNSASNIALAQILVTNLATGQLTPNRSAALVGAQSALAPGQLGPGTGLGVTGGGIASGAGVLAPGLALGLGGASSIASLGLVHASSTVLLLGQSILSYTGNIIASLSFGLTGSSIVSNQGNILFQLPMSPIVPSDERTFFINSENRYLTIEAQNRNLVITDENRIFFIKPPANEIN